MANFDDLVNEVKNEITRLAREKLGGLAKEAKEDAENFLKRTKEDFERWLKLLKDGGLTSDDFLWLSKSKKDLLEMLALKQAGLSLVKAEKFGEELLALITSAALRLLG